MNLYGKYLSIHLKSLMQYKVSFFLTAFGQFLISFSAILGVYFLLDRFHAIKGYTFTDILLCSSVIIMAFSLAECFARGFDQFPKAISNGEFDRMLVRPRSAIFQILASKLELSHIGRMLQAILMMLVAFAKSDIHWSPSKVLTILLMIVGGTVVFSCLFLLYAAFSFFTLEGLEFMNVLTDGGKEFGQYPLAVYGKAVLTFCTVAVPYAWFQQIPLDYLTGNSENILRMFAPLVCFVFLLPCYAIWRFGLRHYRSTGS